jgi:very-short-patch-repair endonuclease/predicted transcriptional regulator of viral defense system
MRDKSAKADISELAARQHGVVSTRQLMAAGLTRSAISRWLRTGGLHRLHQGVYAVGHPAVSMHGRWMAAVLACGGGPSDTGGRTVLESVGSTLSHRSAAALWQLLPPQRGSVDVSIPGNGGREIRRGIRIHRCNSLTPACVTSRHGISVTTPLRTIFDLRRTAPPDEVRRAIRQADVLDLRTGEPETDRTRSELESLLLDLCRRHGLPLPEVNVRVASLLIDFLWRERRLVVETDGFRFHRGREAFEADRERDLKLKALGYDVIRLSHRQVVEQPKQVVEVLRPILLPRDLEADERR